ncbi:hypothetical protein NDU88_005587 [Pleurodeles waltl]|uniref:Uncharacterized protein n=1 Tax=Pleurodeles waltl TaxID=8319 RepID=A0AAV7RLY8_PLEWA|nr:hypothetical protein NDU88_005587 [Pleurodeles waltl]
MKVILRGVCLKTTYGIRKQLGAKLSALEKILPAQPQKLKDWQQARRDLPNDQCRLKKNVDTAYHHRLNAEVDTTQVMLLWLLRQQAARVPVTKLMNERGNQLYTQADINKVFRAQLGRLYTTHMEVMKDNGAVRLVDIAVPKLGEVQRALLEKPISQEEILTSTRCCNASVFNHQSHLDH